MIDHVLARTRRSGQTAVLEANGQAWCAAFLLAVALSSSPSGDARAATAAASDTLPVARMSVVQAMLASSRKEIALVDVRPAGQRMLGHIEGDLAMPFDSLALRHAELPGKPRIVFYCSCPAEELALDAARVALHAGHTRVAVLVGGFDGWRAAGGAIEVDASWEEIFRVDEAPSGWGKIPTDTLRCRYAVDDSVASRGHASGRITCRPDSSARGFAGFTQRIDATELRDRTVTLSAMVRSEGIVGGAFLWIGAEDAGGRIIGMTKPGQAPITGTQEWRLLEVSADISRAASKVLIGLSLTSPGRVWLDDVRLVAPEVVGQPRVRAVVENASFEE
jgi:rhodanese-related sulfurtransferase